MRKRSNKRRSAMKDLVGPEPVDIELNLDEVLADLDPGWFAKDGVK